MFVEVKKRDGSIALVNMNNVFSVEHDQDDYGKDVLVFKGNDGSRSVYASVENLSFVKSVVMCRKDKK